MVILLTDGQTNAGYAPLEAARIASEYGVRVYTVGFGTARGRIVGFSGFSMRAQPDEDALKKIADMTRALLPRQERRRPQAGLQCAVAPAGGGDAGLGDHRLFRKSGGAADGRRRRPFSRLVSPHIIISVSQARPGDSRPR